MARISRVIFEVFFGHGRHGPVLTAPSGRACSGGPASGCSPCIAWCRPFPAAWGRGFQCGEFLGTGLLLPGVILRMDVFSACYQCCAEQNEYEISEYCLYFFRHNRRLAEIVFPAVYRISYIGRPEADILYKLDILKKMQFFKPDMSISISAQSHITSAFSMDSDFEVVDNTDWQNVIWWAWKDRIWVE